MLRTIATLIKPTSVLFRILVDAPGSVGYSTPCVPHCRERKRRDETNVSAKLVALVSDKRREFEDASNTTTRAPRTSHVPRCPGVQWCPQKMSCACFKGFSKVIAIQSQRGWAQSEDQGRHRPRDRACPARAPAMKTGKGDTTQITCSSLHMPHCDESAEVTVTMVCRVWTRWFTGQCAFQYATAVRA